MPTKSGRPSPKGIGLSALAPTPVYLTSLVGRRQEAEDLRGLMAGSRLVSIIGPGGIGKTRLATAVADAEREAFRGDVAWIDLAPVSDPDALARHVTGTLGLREHPGRSPLDALVELIGDAHALLVLDNCEHLPGACAELVDALLRRCRALHVLTTSRQALGVPGEKAWQLPPLALPEADAGAADADAIRLFVERARDVSPGFELTDANAGAIARICCRLDGLPLAIELAAARVRLLPPEQLAARLESILGLLTTTSQLTLPRHRTLRALIDWSHDLLDTEERVLLARLSVFAGGFTLDAAERVAGGGRLPTERVLDCLAGLVDKSLVAMRDTRGEARYTLLETVREYAREKLEEGTTEDGWENASLCQRHAEHFLALVESSASSLRGGEQVDVLETLSLEHENIRNGLEWCIRREDAERSLRFCVALRDFWRLRGHFTEGMRYLRAALDLGEGPDRLRSRALVVMALYAQMRGEYPVMRDAATAAEALARRGCDRAVLAEALCSVGVEMRLQNDLEPAARKLDESIEIWREVGDARGLILALGARASVALSAGDTALARALRLSAVEEARRARDRESEAAGLIGLGEVARLEGDVDGARSYNQLALEIFDELGDRWHAGAVYQNLGWVEAESGRAEEAFRAFSNALGKFPLAGNPFGLTLCLFGLSRVLHESGDSREAAVVVGCAEAEAARVRIRAAAAADEACCDRTRAAIAAALPPDELERAHAEGATLSLAQGLQRAMARLGRRFPKVVRHRPGAPSPASASVAAPTVQGPADLTVRALGPLEIRLQGQPLEGDAFGSSKPRELLLLLLCTPGGCTRDQVGLAFWPDAAGPQVKNNFHVTLHRLRKALAPVDAIVMSGDRYGIHPKLSVDFDVVRFEAAAQAALAQGDDSEAESRLEEALTLYRGDFLDGEAVGDWHLEIQDRLRRLFFAAKLAYGERLLRAERLAEAVATLRELLARDPLHEPAYRLLMTCEARAGERVSALRLYETLQTLLREELGAEPDPSTTELYRKLMEVRAV